MREKKAIRTVRSGALSQCVRELLDASQAEGTRRAYASDLATFETWCSSVGAIALPSSAETLAAYVAHRVASGAKASTITRAMAGLRAAHVTRGLPWAGSHEGVRRVLQGMRRKLGTSPKKKDAITADTLGEIVAHLPPGLGGIRDRALLLLGWAGAFRRAELAGITADDLRWEKRGLIVRVRRSKTDQEGRGALRAIPEGPATKALRAWLQASGIVDGHVFRAVNRHGVIGGALSGHAIGAIVQRAADGAYIDPATVGGHSLRAGFITTAATRGRSLESIMRHTGHRSVAVAQGYIRRATLWDDHAGADLLK